MIHRGGRRCVIIHIRFTRIHNGMNTLLTHVLGEHTPQGDPKLLLLLELIVDTCGKSFVTARHCNALQHTATRCSTLQHTVTHCNTLQHTAIHCKHTATHCKHTATPCNTLQCPSTTHCNTLQHEPPPTAISRWMQGTCSGRKPPSNMCTLQHTATHCNTLQHTATHCRTVPHTTPHCNILQYNIPPIPFLKLMQGMYTGHEPPFDMQTFQHTATH